MKKEKAEWDLLYVWPAFVPVMRFKGKMYVEIRDFECCIRDIQRELEEENKKLKSDLAFERTMLDNVRAEYKSLQNVIKNLKEELSKYKKQYQHSMWFSDFWWYDD